MAVIVKEDKKILVTPISREDLKDIHIGDIVYLSGDLTTCRDVAHRRVVEEGREIPVDVRDEAILHAGPIIRPALGAHRQGQCPQGSRRHKIRYA